MVSTGWTDTPAVIEQTSFVDVPDLRPSSGNRLDCMPRALKRYYAHQNEARLLEKSAELIERPLAAGERLIR
jgi:hypothetical protein